MNAKKINDLSFYNDQGTLTLNAKQFDTGRLFSFNIIDNDEPFDLSNCRVYLRMLKADGTQFQGEECCTISNNLITIDTSVANGNQILTCPGKNQCELHLTDENGKSLTTWTFIINVVPRVHDGSNIDSKDTWDLWDNIRDTFLKLKDTLTNTLNNHVNNTNNPHKVTKEQLDLENVPNVSTNNQTPDFDEAIERKNIISGEKLSVILGKVKKYFADLKDVAFSGSYNDLKDTPDLKTVATSGSYNDLLNRPTVTSLNSNHRITTLTNISQINEIGFWDISAIDSSYATEIGIDENVGDFHAICCNYNGKGTTFYFGCLLLFSPRLGSKYYYINVWNNKAASIKSILKSNLLNTIEQISANTSTDNVCSALALKAAMADYTNKFNQINSDLQYEIFSLPNVQSSEEIQINIPNLYRYRWIVLRFVESNTNHTAYVTIPGKCLNITHLDMICNFDGNLGTITTVPKQTFTPEKISLQWSHTGFRLAELVGYFV